MDNELPKDTEGLTGTEGEVRSSDGFSKRVVKKSSKRNSKSASGTEEGAEITGTDAESAITGAETGPTETSSAAATKRTGKRTAKTAAKTTENVINFHVTIINGINLGLSILTKIEEFRDTNPEQVKELAKALVDFENEFGIKTEMSGKAAAIINLVYAAIGVYAPVVIKHNITKALKGDGNATS